MQATAAAFSLKLRNYASCLNERRSNVAGCHSHIFRKIKDVDLVAKPSKMPTVDPSTHCAGLLIIRSLHNHLLESLCPIKFKHSVHQAGDEAFPILRCTPHSTFFGAELRIRADEETSLIKVVSGSLWALSKGLEGAQGHVFQVPTTIPGWKGISHQTH
jgi:hypothetical protein